MLEMQKPAEAGYRFWARVSHTGYTMLDFGVASYRLARQREADNLVDLNCCVVIVRADAWTE